MPTGATWTNPNATVYGTTQTFYLPFYRLRNVPDSLMQRFAGVMTQFVSAANRQRMFNAGVQIEICPRSTTDGVFFGGLRNSSYFFDNGGLTGGKNIALNGRGGAYPPENEGAYAGYIGSMLHEYAHAEDGNTLGGGNSIASNSGFLTLQNDCQANGADAGATGGHFVTSFRVPQRLEALFTTVTKANCITATNKNIDLTTGGIPASDSTGSITVAVGNRVMVRAQNLSKENGLYVVASGAWTRTADSNTTALMQPGTRVFVTSGDYANFWFALFGVSALTLGTSPMCFHRDVMLNSAGHNSIGGLTPQSRVDRWNSLCATNGITL